MSENEKDGQAVEQTSDTAENDVVADAQTPDTPQDADTTESEPVVNADGTATAEAPKYTGFLSKLDKFFGIAKAGSNFRTEIIAGLTTFMAMVYILMVNAGFFELTGAVSYGGSYIATAIGAVVGTMLMALLAKMPLAQASGMGINAYVVFTLINFGATGLTYANTMVFVLIDGVIFLLLTVTGLRKKIFEAIPKAVRYAIPVGIGLFIAFIGMQQSGIIVNEDSTLVTFTSFNVLSDKTAFVSYVAGTVGGMLPAIIAIVGVIAIAVMSKKNVKGAILWGILGSTALYYILLAIAKGAGIEAASNIFSSIKIDNPINAFKDWGNQAVGQVFVNGFNFDTYLAIEGNNAGSLVLVFITSALSLCMIDMFDTLGTLYGACAKGNLLDENGAPVNMEKMMLCDAIATCTGAIAGTSTVTTFVESSSGVAAGGRTGFTALVTSLCFLVAMFLSPIAQLVPRSATATALIWVGILMMTSVTKVEWSDPVEAIVGFFTLIIMLLGYSIAKGIGAGIIVYILVKICTGKAKDISIPTAVLGTLFLLMFILT